MPTSSHCNSYEMSFTALNSVLFVKVMNPLLGKAFLRLGVFCGYCLFGAWIFIIIERKDESADEVMERMLKDLRTEITFKYNMTDNDFDNFIVKAAAALSAGDKLDWSFPKSGAFVFAALTKVGKTPCDVTLYDVLGFILFLRKSEITCFDGKLTNVLHSGNSRTKIKLNGSNHSELDILAKISATYAYWINIYECEISIETTECFRSGTIG